MSRLVGSPAMFAVAAFDALLANIAILDQRGRIIAVNRAWEQFARENAQPPPGQDRIGEHDPVPNSLGVNYLDICEATVGEDRVYALNIAADIRGVLAGQQDGSTEYPCLLADGMHYYLARVSGFVQDGQRYAVVAHEDITRRKQAELEVQALNRTLEQRVQERSRQLEEQNAELQRIGRVLEENNEALLESNLQLAQFAHVASHDLQEPLRIMGAYSDMLRHRYLDTLDARGQGYLNHITEQVGRARQLVRDVLSFSSVSYQPERDRVQLDALWEEAIRFLSWPPDAQLTHGDLPEVRASPAQVRQLLGNLLGNSLKFRSGRPLSVRFEVAARPEQPLPGFTELVLSDNGIGIAPEYREQVFGMFQRLHGRAASGGNGIGLAICKKIVEGHGGRIWFGEGSAAGQGVAVHFTLPRA